MSFEADGHTPHEVIEEEKQSYRQKALPEVGTDWPADVKAVAEELHGRLFELDLRMMEVYRECGCYNRNISSTFRWFLGRTPKEYVLHHRLEFAKQLLRETDFRVVRIALGVGYGNPGAFTKVFKKHVGTTPTQFRKTQEK